MVPYEINVFAAADAGTGTPIDRVTEPIKRTIDELATLLFSWWNDFAEADAPGDYVTGVIKLLLALLIAYLLFKGIVARGIKVMRTKRGGKPVVEQVTETHSTTTR